MDQLVLRSGATGALAFGAGAAMQLATGSVWGALAAAAIAAAASAWWTAPRAVPVEHQVTPRPESPAQLNDAALSALPVGVLIVAPDRTVRFANPTFETLLARPGIAGHPVSLVRANALLGLIEAAFAGRAPEPIEFTLSRGGELHLRAHASALDDGTVVVALMDRTRQQRAEAVHRDFVANASHELKTPLAASAGIIETLLGHAREDPEAQTRFLGLLSAQVRRMTRLIEDLLSLNRIELDARLLPEEPQDLTSLVGETVDALSPVAQSQGVTLDYARPEGPRLTTGDRDELGQLFLNLIDNAVKYGGEGTTVRIRFVGQPDESGRIGVAVEDEGIGIAREHLPRLTERFYRVNVRRSREVGGTGLGLAIVKHILNRHRGHLTVESEPGRGSRFTAWLPDRAGPASQNVHTDVTDRSSPVPSQRASANGGRPVDRADAET